MAVVGDAYLGSYVDVHIVWKYRFFSLKLSDEQIERF